MEQSPARFLIIVAFLASIACLVIAPLALPDSYSVVEHTTSEAAAQATEGAWLARSGFLLFGLGVFCLSIVKRDWPMSVRYLHGLFGVAMIATAVYSHRPTLDATDYDRVEDTLHSVAATGMGFAFAAGVLVAGWRRIPRWRVFDIVALLSAIVIPMVMVTTENADGLWQRGMFLIAFAWFGIEAMESRRRTAFNPID